MRWNRGFGRVKEERKNLSFLKIFHSADLSSESMRAIPYNFMKNVSKKDFSYNMVIITQWGSSWEVDISKNPRFYYMEKSGWNKFVSDNALGDNKFVTFTHKELMCFDVNIYLHNGEEIVVPQKLQKTTPSGIKKEEGERIYKDVEIGEFSKGAVIRKKKAKQHKPCKKKKNGVPGFKITIRKTYLSLLAIPKKFEEAYIKRESKVYKIHHSEGKGSWEVICLVRQNRKIFSSGWSKLAREYPLSVGDRCTLHLIKPTEFVLTSKKAREEMIY